MTKNSEKHYRELLDVIELKLVEEQLRESQKIEAMGQVARRLAHDFNNLFTAIQGYSSLALQRANPDDRMRRYLEEIMKAAERATELTRQLSAFGGTLDPDRESGLQEGLIDYEAEQEEAQHERRSN